MGNAITCGTDVHDKWLGPETAVGPARPESLSFRNDSDGRGRMIREFRRRSGQAGGARVVAVHEAPGAGEAAPALAQRPAGVYRASGWGAGC